MNAKIIASETFGAYRLDVLRTRFGGFEFFVVDADGETIRQSDDIVVATSGLHAEPGISEAVVAALAAVCKMDKTTEKLRSPKRSGRHSRP
jgi:hypothetical protein